jgi:alkylated DNA repair dioxygenase AlkB
MSFEKEYYKEIKNAVPKEVCRVAAKEFEMARDLAGYAVDNGHPYPYQDEMVEKSFSWYSPLIFESLSDTIVKDIVEKEIGEPVYPTYTYARIYYTGAEMKYHIDRSSSEFSVSLCIKTDPNHEWHLGMETLEGEKKYIIQKPGDAVLYRGNELYHWRDPYEGTEQINAFFFFVRAKGPKAVLKYDTRPMLGMGPESRKWNSDKQWELFPGPKENPPNE